MIKTICKTALWIVILSATAQADIRIYDVEPTIQKELANAIDSVLHNLPLERDAEGNTTRRRSSLQTLPNGQLLIDADEEIHQQIESILEVIEKKRVSMSPTIELEYWLIYADSDTGSDRPESLAILNDTLDDIERAHGSLRFSALEYARLNSQSGHKSSFISEPLVIRQRLYNNQQSATGELHLEDRASNQVLDLTITIAPGEFVVLSANTARRGEEDGLILYIVHWPVKG